MSPPSPVHRSLHRRAARTLVLTCLGLLAIRPASGREERAWDLADLSLEELMNETVTSVSKREQKLSDAASAVTVLSDDDLRRSGATTLADALRLVPGMNVGSVNSNQWSVSARGFNGLYANKLLVLIDGRPVYSPMFAGVYWNTQHAIFEDVDRIEVIRGPGATVWGANAVNGVVNIVTRGARESQGGFVQGSAGDVEEHSAAVRYGGRLGDKTYYRVHVGEQARDAFRLPDGDRADDAWRARHGGARVDHHPGDDAQLTWLAGVTDTETDDRLSETSNVHTLARLTRRWSDRSGIEVQAYYDRFAYDDLTRANIRSDTFDLSAEHTFGVGERHDFIWGLGFRYIDNVVEQTTPSLEIRDGTLRTRLFSAFVQDEFKLVPEKLTLTAGLKVEHNDYTGAELQPSLRAIWKPSERQTLWAAVSRAVRTPSGIEGKDVFAVAAGEPFVGPGGGLYLPRVVGEPGLSSEVLWAYEAGYRIQPASRVSVDAALFYNVYENLISIGEVSRFLPGAPLGTAEIPFANALRGETGGGEISVTVAPTDAWRLTASYSLLLTHIEGPASANPRDIEEGSPRNQAVLRSAHDLTRRLHVDAQLRYVDSIRSVPAYLTADLRVAYQLNERLEAALVGQNLLQDQHREQGSAFFAATTEVPRGCYGKLTWRF